MFEYAPDKSSANLAKHGIDFDAAQALWSDDRRLAVDAQFVAEPRQLVIGGIGERVWTAVINTRDETIRIISVRRSRDNAVKAYES